MEHKTNSVILFGGLGFFFCSWWYVFIQNFGILPTFNCMTARTRQLPLTGAEFSAPGPFPGAET